MITAWGNKSLSSYSNSFKRMTANILANYVQKSIESHLESYLFEPNSKQTRKNIENSFRGFLHSIASRGDIKNDYRVICDEFNNSPDSIDRGELNVDIIYRSSNSFEFTHISSTLSPSKGECKTNKVNLPEELFYIEE